MKLVERMPRVCKAVIKAKGGYLKNIKYEIYFNLTQFHTYYPDTDSYHLVVYSIVQPEWALGEADEPVAILTSTLFNIIQILTVYSSFPPQWTLGEADEPVAILTSTVFNIIQILTGL
jgi:hypothetical protein